MKKYRPSFLFTFVLINNLLLQYDVSLGYFRDGRVYYSATEKKVRIIESITPEATRPQFDELLDFSGVSKLNYIFLLLKNKKLINAFCQHLLQVYFNGYCADQQL